MRRFIAVFFQLMLPVLLFGITPVQKEYHHRMITKADGLPQDFIYAIYQDELGYFWISTGKGLVRYNGSEMITITAADGLADDLVNSLVMGQDGFVWAGHFKGGISRISPEFFRNRSDTTKKYIKTFSTKKGIKSPIVDVIESSDHRIIIGTRSDGIYLVSDHNELLEMGHSFGDAEIVNMETATDSTIFVATDQGLYRTSKKGRKLIIEHQWEVLKNVGVQTIYSHEEHSCVIGNNGKFYFLKEASNSLIEITDVPVELLEKVEDIKTIQIGPMNNVWIGTKNDGVYIVNVDHQNLSVSIKSHLTRENGLGTNRVNCMLRDVQGVLWIGSYGNGVASLYPNAFKLHDQGLFSGKHAPAEQVRDQVWIGAEGGIVVSNLQGIGIDFIALDAEVTALAYDKRNDKVWIGTLEDGVYSKAGNSPIRQERFGDTRLSNSINYMTYQANKGLWVATLEGVFFCDEENKVKHFTTSDGLLHNNVNHIFVDSKGSIWLTSDGFGINKFNWERFDQFIPQSSEGVTIVQCIEEDQNGHLWFGTNGEGVYVYDGAEFENINTRDGLASNYVYALKRDVNGVVWVGHQNAISWATGVNERVRTFDKLNGFFGEQIIAHGLTADSSGQIWVATNHGVLRYNDEYNAMFNAEPKIYLGGITLFDESVSTTSMLDLKYDKYRINFLVDVVSSKFAGQGDFEYKLDGFNMQWETLPAHGNLLYPNLGDGEYDLLVRRVGEQAAELEYNIYIAPPLWRNWWFILTAALCFLGLTFAGVQLRLRSLKRSKKVLEGLVEERTLELTEKTSQISLMFESLPVISYMTEVEIRGEEAVFKYNYVSNSFERRTGYKTEQIVGDDLFWEQNIHPEDHSSIVPNLFSFYIKGSSEFDFRWKVADGTYRWFRNLSRKVELKPGVINHVGMWLDITENKAAEDLLKASEERYRDIIQSSLDIICTHDLDGQIVSLNPAFTAIMGYNSFEYKDRNLKDFMVDKYRPQFDTYLKELESKGEATGYMQLKAKDGSIKIIEYKNTLKKSDGAAPIVRGLARDVTQKVNAEREIKSLNTELEKRVTERTQQLRQSNEQLKLKIEEHIETEAELKDINHELDTFVYKATHDLKGPLASVIGLINLAEAETKTGDDAFFYYNLINRGVTHLDDILNALLAATTIKEGQLNVEPLDLSLVVEDVIQALKNRPDADGVSFSCDISDRDMFVSDKYLITSITQNIIENAIKYGRNRTNKTKILCKIDNVDKGIMLSISDNGDGMADEIKEKIFDMFFRGHETSKGSGLGLYIVKTAVKKLGGEIKVSSECGVGSTFSVFIPDGQQQRISA